MDLNSIHATAHFMRTKILDVSHRCSLSTHLGGGLSIVDIMATLYSSVLRYRVVDPSWEDRDRFILSKGHGVLGYYAALLAAGIISEENFASFQTNESDLISHPVMNLNLGIESSNGSLGHGLSLAVGISLAAKKKGKDFKTYVLLGDGECDEGSVWEAIMAAAHLRLDNLTAIIDYNKLQSDGDSRQIIDLGDLAGKFAAFGWNVCDINGHDIDAISAAFAKEFERVAPKVIVAHTVKGKGISFMENNNVWHHNRLTKTNFDLALAELGVTHA